ncbi:MAG: SDR family oxidoreductase [Acidiferrobacterales bacterium]|nr:SDR family oxidoreductase [Acidiferrobacterales bacterium]
MSEDSIESQQPLTGKRAIVCGSTRGIGRACAFELAKVGAQVTLLARDAQALLRTRDDLSKASWPTPEHDCLVADFTDPHQVSRLAREYLERSGPAHILINNTGGPPSGSILEAHPDAFLAAFGNHLLCNHLLAQAVIPGMKQAGYGRIINIVSTSVKQPIAGLGVSNTVRGAVASWAKTLAGEVARHGITVNNVLPGATRTDRLLAIIEHRAKSLGVTVHEVEHTMKSEIPARRFAEPEEIAAAVGFLASPAASYITGVSLAVDGGRTNCL